MDSATTDSLFSFALEHHRTGRLAAAEEAYRRVLAIAPDHAETLHCLGVLEHQRGRSAAAVELIERAIARDGGVAEFHYNLGVALEALRRPADAAAHYRAAIALKPDYAKAYLNLANVLLAEDKPDEAEAACRRAAALVPAWPDAPFNLGVILARRHRFTDAIAQFHEVVRLRPDFAAAHVHLRAAYAETGNIEKAAYHSRRALTLDPGNQQEAVALGLICLVKGDGKQALDGALYALNIIDTPQARHLFTRSARYATFDTPRFRELLRRALAEGWSRPSHLMQPALRLVKANNGVRAAIAGLAAAPHWPSAAELHGAEWLSGMANDPLLGELMRSTPVCDSALEQVFTGLRRGLLDLASEDERQAVALPTLALFCALAEQCFVNEYVYAVAEDERERADALGQRLVVAAAEAKEISPLWIAAAGAYGPLHALSCADLLVKRPWPAPVAAVLHRQVTEPNAQRHIGVSLERLTAIEDGTSIAVKRQYEENPFPQWRGFESTLTPVPLDDYMRTTFPSAPYRPLGKSRIDVLIAGCGTGRHAIETSRRFAGADVLAIDLSVASLGYAAYKARELHTANIRYAVADILKLDALGRSFDVIEASGVLHHMAEPFAAWRLLLKLVRPGGVMNIGLYSAQARDFVVRARQFIAERGYPANHDGIRRCRQEMVRSPDPILKTITQSPEFFSMSECRDLLFHVQEHRMTLPQIASFIEEENLTFLGFEAEAGLLRRYQARFPADQSKTDLSSWHRFEMENPRSFSGMYQFSIQKP